MNRLSHVQNGLAGGVSQSFVAADPKQPANGSDVVVCAALRTAMCKMGRSGRDSAPLSGTKLVATTAAAAWAPMNAPIY